MRQSPGFAAIAVATLALGIGGTTAIFSVVNTMMLRSLPFAQPDRLIRVFEKNEKLKLRQFSASVLNYLSWNEQNRSFESLGVIGFASFNWTGSGDPEQLNAVTVTPSVIPMLGLSPLLGRIFRDDEERPGAAPVAMLSEGLWKRRFSGDASAIGKVMTLSGTGYTIVGVAPAALAVISTGDLVIPMTIDRTKEIRLNHVVSAIGRLKPGVTLQQARSDMDGVSAQVGRQFPETKEWGIDLVPFYNWLVPDQLRTALWVLLGAVLLVLLAACTNVANLLLARASARRKEMAVRAAIGASRARLVRQLLTESLALAVLGGGLGLLGAVWAVQLMNRKLPPNLLPLPTIEMDRGVLLFAFAITLATGLLFGMAPIWQSARADLNTVLREAGRSGSGGPRPMVRNGLVAVEFALATMLLIGAGLLLQSLFRLQNVSVGFRTENLLTFQLSPSPAKYKGPGTGWNFYREMMQRFREIPGVRGSAISSGLPFGNGSYTQTPMSPVGHSLLAPGSSVPVEWRIVSPGFLRAMEIPLLRGRDFDDRDTGPAVPDVPVPAVISQETAQAFWGDEDPLGRSYKLVASGRVFTVIGVAGDVRSTALNQAPQPAMYMPAGPRLLGVMDIAVRTEGKPELLVGAIRRKIHDLDPEMPLSNVRTLETYISQSSAQPRLNALLVAIFASVTLLIGAIGVYGVLAYSVNQRTREIGLRMALGAEQSNVLRLVIREGVLVAAAGIAAGIAGALALSRVLATLVFGIKVYDLATFIGVAAVLAAIALAASYLPARRASGVDPSIALRYE